MQNFYLILEIVKIRGGKIVNSPVELQDTNHCSMYMYIRCRCVLILIITLI